MANNEQQTLHKILTDEYSETHEFTFTEDGMLTIRDIASLEEGNDDNPAEFVRLNLHSVSVLFRFLDQPEIQNLIHRW